MTNEFGEDPSIYVYPTDHEDGEPFPEDFWERVRRALSAEGINYEHV